MKPATAMLLGLFALGMYLLYRSLQNVSSSVQSIQGKVDSTLTGLESVPGTAWSTLKSEGGALGTSLLAPAQALASLGTTAYNSLFGPGSTTTSSGLTDLSGITGPSLLMADGSVANTTLPSDLSTGVLLPNGGSLSWPSLPADASTSGFNPSPAGLGLVGANSDGSYGSLTDSSPGDGFLPSDYTSSDYNFDSSLLDSGLL